jgi:hypothetical protein
VHPAALNPLGQMPPRLPPPRIAPLTAQSASAARSLQQLGKGKGKNYVNPAPLALVQQANYIAPANPILEPAWIAPTGVGFRLPRLPARPAAVTAVTPAFISPVQQGPIYASGMAIPAPGPIILPVGARFLPVNPARSRRGRLGFPLPQCQGSNGSGTTAWHAQCGLSNPLAHDRAPSPAAPPSAPAPAETPQVPLPAS